MKNSYCYIFLTSISLLLFATRPFAQFIATGREIGVGTATAQTIEPSISQEPFDVVSPLVWVATGATREGKQVTIRWTTSTQVNVKCFQIESSVNGRDWKVVASGIHAFTLPGISRYERSLAVRKHKKQYYRIRQEDFDGSSSYSPVMLATKAN